MKDGKSVRGRLDAVQHLVMMAQAVAGFKYRDRLGISDEQAEIGLHQFWVMVEGLILRGTAAQIVCERWSREAEVEMALERLQAEADTYHREKRQQAQAAVLIAPKNLPEALNRDELRREKRRRKARHERTQSTKEATHETA